MRRRAEALKTKHAAPVFAALGDEARLRLVTRLCEDGPSSIATLTKGSRITRQAITKHLRVMEDVGLVRAEKRGRETIFELEPARLAAAQRALDAISREWDHAIARLKKLVES